MINTNTRFFVGLNIAAAIAAVFMSCSEPVNETPVISSIIAESDTIQVEQSIVITCTASDPDGDAKTYLWSVVNGSISGTGPSVTYTAPEVGGTFTVTCTVNDGNGGETSASIDIYVFFNNRPQINQLETGDFTIDPNSSTTVICNASDAEGNNLSYDWQVTGGIIVGTGSEVLYLAPASEGIYIITCIVSDGFSGLDTATVEIDVHNNLPPDIYRMTSLPSKLMIDRTAVITSDVYDAELDSLTFVWSASSGTITGDGNSAVYTAPSTVGTYTITCTASDGAGGNDTETLDIEVYTLVYGTVTDVDGNQYITVVIGDQEWMTENLRVTRYSNGDDIPLITTSSEWQNLTGGARAIMENYPVYEADYGYLYNGAAILDQRNIAPQGWHVPTDSEWQDLIDLMGGPDQAGGNLKSIGTEYWDSPNIGATDQSDFSALPGGYIDNYGDYWLPGEAGYFWTSTAHNADNIWSVATYYNDAEIWHGYSLSEFGYSVRCIKD